MSDKKCTTHHHACDCREAKVRVIIEDMLKYQLAYDRESERVMRKAKEFLAERTKHEKTFKDIDHVSSKA